jgi:outer membrane receptor protein involved in Fe transport
VTAQRVFTQTYEAQGIELEANYAVSDNFLLSGNFTWTDAEIVEADNPDVIGNQPNRQADYIFTITPEYVTDSLSVGASFVGSGDFYLGDSETVKQDAYELIHLFASYNVNDNLTVNLTSNNLTDEFVNSFSESGVFDYNGQNINLAEVLNGRTTNLSVKYRF